MSGVFRVLLSRVGIGRYAHALVGWIVKKWDRTQVIDFPIQEKMKSKVLWIHVFMYTSNL